ncbi:hypothetical protein G6F57_020428 [Rhizopus arrhizus]|nr:hypothetical protein G6F57_020428 [Rhizopus arrhizus]
MKEPPCAVRCGPGRGAGGGGGTDRPQRDGPQHRHQVPVRPAARQPGQHPIRRTFVAGHGAIPDRQAGAVAGAGRAADLSHADRRGKPGGHGQRTGPRPGLDAASCLCAVSPAAGTPHEPGHATVGRRAADVGAGARADDQPQPAGAGRGH